MIKCVIFDLHDTIFNTTDAVKKTVKSFPEIRALRKAGFNIPRAKYFAARKYMDETYLSLPKTQKSNPLIFANLFLIGAGIKPTKKLALLEKKEFQDECDKHHKPFPRVKETLKFLLKNKIVITAISNSTDSHTTLLLDKYGLKKYFKQILFSRGIGYEKNELIPFKELINRINKKRKNKLLPEEFLMVGNDEKEDLAAKKLGLKVALLNSPHKKIKFTKKYCPDYTISMISDIIQIVESNLDT